MHQKELPTHLEVTQAELAKLEQKYACDFKTFEAQLQTQTESFERWDDYMIWKALIQTYADIQRKLI